VSDAESPDASEVTRRGLEAIDEQFALIDDVMAKVSCHHDEGRHDLASEALAVAVEVLSNVVEFLGLSARHLGEPQEAVVKEGVLPTFELVETALESRDWDQLSRILRDDLPAIIGQLRQWAASLASKAGS
jgi:hypothetical protein